MDEMDRWALGLLHISRMGLMPVQMPYCELYESECYEFDQYWLFDN